MQTLQTRKPVDRPLHEGVSRDDRLDVLGRSRGAQDLCRVRRHLGRRWPSARATSSSPRRRSIPDQIVGLDTIVQDAVDAQVHGGAADARNSCRADPDSAAAVDSRGPREPAERSRARTAAQAAPRAGSRSSAATSSPRRCARLAIPYIALNPGASFRGLHDSLVNFLGNRDPQMLLCLHEEHAVAIAHGYAKVTGPSRWRSRVHSNVGLLHATMAIFNAWCDRMPVLMLGATGPVDAAKRRPWIDWIHTARDQGALVRALRQVGRPAGLARRRARSRCCARRGTRDRAAGPGLRQPRRARCRRRRSPAPLPPIDAARYHAATPSAAAAPTQRARGCDAAARREASAAPDRPRVARRSTRGTRASRWPRRSGRAWSPTSRSARRFPTDHPLHVDAPGDHAARRARRRRSRRPT